MIKYFTIQTISGSGLGDQLGTQFTRLYGLGKILGASYIYTPLVFNRSIKPVWYALSENIIFKIRYFLLFVFGQNIFTNALNVLLLRTEKIINSLQLKYNDFTLNDFLGINKLGENEISNKKIVDVGIEEFFESSGDLSLSAYISFIESKFQTHDENIVICLKWGANMWQLIPKIDKILNELLLSKEDVINTLFAKGFDHLHPNIKSEKVNIVFHIRCGDSTKITLGNRSLIVYDKFLYQDESEMEQILSIDPDRVSIPPEEYLKIYDSITGNWDLDKCKICIISDGYHLTYCNIMRNLLKRKCNVKLNQEEKKQLKLHIKEKNSIFDKFQQAELIIGESKQNLYKSILCLAGADLLIWGCGGFACNIHNLFSATAKDNNIYKVSELDSESLEKLKEKYNA